MFRTAVNEDFNQLARIFTLGAHVGTFSDVMVYIYMTVLWYYTNIMISYVHVLLSIATIIYVKYITMNYTATLKHRKKRRLGTYMDKSRPTQKNNLKDCLWKQRKHKRTKIGDSVFIKSLHMQHMKSHV